MLVPCCSDGIWSCGVAPGPVLTNSQEDVLQSGVRTYVRTGRCSCKLSLPGSSAWHAEWYVDFPAAVTRRLMRKQRRVEVVSFLDLQVTRNPTSTVHSAFVPCSFTSLWFITSFAAFTRIAPRLVPRTNLTASARTVLPRPFGPTIAVKLG
jgi:hypothetical protein